MTVLLSATLSLIATAIITTVINHAFSNELPIIYHVISVNYFEIIILMFTAKLKRNTITLFREISNREV